MPSLQDMDARVMEKIAFRCDLESAARLTLVNKHVYGVVKPVLPWLCDTKDLQLRCRAMPKTTSRDGSGGDWPLQKATHTWRS